MMWWNDACQRDPGNAGSIVTLASRQHPMECVDLSGWGDGTPGWDCPSSQVSGVRKEQDVGESGGDTPGVVPLDRCRREAIFFAIHGSNGSPHCVKGTRGDEPPPHFSGSTADHSLT
jgi:hypothetical protein